jgi:hypothetical protein
VVSSEEPEEAALHNAIEELRDPSHVRMLPASELASLVAAAGFAIEAQTTWDQSREFEEWSRIVNDPERIGPLRTIVRALAAAHQHAGFGLSSGDGGGIVFSHRWRLIAGRKPRTA